MGSAYADAGAIAIDMPSGSVLPVVTLGVAAVQAALAATSATALGRLRPGYTSVHGPFLIVFRATDIAGNESPYATRTIYIDASCPDGEIRCWTYRRCSERGLCLPSAVADPVTYAPPEDTFEPPVDTTPPKLELNTAQGDDVRVDRGTQVVITSLRSGEMYTELGWSATDEVDGDVSERVAAAGLAAVTAAVATGAPTDGNTPHVIRYSVKDAAGNAAAAVRAIHVLCAAGERRCDEGDGSFCSVQGLCVHLGGAAPAVVEPTITLVGDDVVYVEQGQPFGMCPRSRPVELICDQVCHCFIFQHALLPRLGSHT